MFSKVTLERFRGFRRLEVEPLKRVNLFVGANNCGKSSLLEALFLLSNPVNPELPSRINALRGMAPGSEEFLSSLFPGFDTQREIVLHADDAEPSALKRRPRTLRIRPLHNGVGTTTGGAEGVEGGGASTSRARVTGLLLDFSDRAGGKHETRLTASAPVGHPAPELSIHLAKDVWFPNSVIYTGLARGWKKENADRLSRVRIEGRATAIVGGLRAILPELRDLEVASHGPAPSIYADVGWERLVPVEVLGDGLNRALSILLAINDSNGANALVDEIENGLHHSALVPFWQAVYRVARDQNVQLFTTTHSEECCIAALEAQEQEGSDDLMVFRLECTDDGHRAVPMNVEDLRTLIDLRVEIRG